MGKKPEILFVCGAGLGSSFAAQMTAEDVLKKYNVEAKLDHVDISSASSSAADIIITAANFKSQFEKFTFKEDTAIIYMKNLVSKAEMEEKILPVLKEKNFI